MFFNILTLFGFLHDNVAEVIEKISKEREQTASGKEVLEGLKEAIANDEELTETQKEFLREVMADKTAELLGKDEIIKKMTRKKPGLVRRLLERVVNFIKALGESKETREARKFLTELQKRLENALQEMGLAYNLAKAMGEEVDEKENGEEEIEKITENIENAQERYSYEALVAKNDIELIDVDDNVDIKPNNETRKETVDEALKSAIAEGYVDKAGRGVVKVADTGTPVLVTKNALRHGLDRRLNIMVPVVKKIGPILKESIKINELETRSNAISESYILIGAARGVTGAIYPTLFVVNKFTDELENVDVLYSANVKKVSAGPKGPDITENNSVSLTDTTISVAQLLEIVNKKFPDVLSMDVLNHFGVKERPKGTLGESVLFSKKENNSTNNRHSKKQVRTTLEERVNGDALLDAQDLIEEVRSRGGEVDENGYIKLYHRTSADKAAQIRKTGRMIGKEDGLFFSTKESGYNDGYGNTVVELEIPAEKLVLDDIFADEAHLRLPMTKPGTMDVSDYLVKSGDLIVKHSRKSPMISPEGKKMSEAQTDKAIANATREKTYSREDVHKIVQTAVGSMNAESVDVGLKILGRMKGKGIETIESEIYKKINLADKEEAAAIARDLADLILETATLKDISSDQKHEESMHIISEVKSYLRRIDLSQLKGEIRQKYDKKSAGIFSRWGVRKGERAITADMAAQELREAGVRLDTRSDSEADLLFEIDRVYSKALEDVKKDAKLRFKDALTKEEIVQKFKWKGMLRCLHRKINPKDGRLLNLLPAKRGFCRNHLKNSGKCAMMIFKKTDLRFRTKELERVVS